MKGSAASHPARPLPMLARRALAVAALGSPALRPQLQRQHRVCATSQEPEPAMAPKKKASAGKASGGVAKKKAAPKAAAAAAPPAVVEAGAVAIEACKS